MDKEKLAEKSRAYYAANREKAAERSRKYQTANREKIAQQKRAYRAANKEKLAEKNYAYRAVNKDRIAERNRMYHAAHPENGIKGTENWRKRREAAATRPRPDFCEACGGPPTGEILEFDHCHVLDKFRGWLCHNCNKALGNAKDNPERLRQLITYLEKYDI